MPGNKYYGLCQGALGTYWGPLSTLNQTVDTPSLAFTCVCKCLELIRGESLGPSQDFPELVPSLIHPCDLPDPQEYVRDFQSTCGYLTPFKFFY